MAIQNVTRYPRLGPVPKSPKAELWHYTLTYPFQVAPRLAGVSCLIEQSFRPGQDYTNGVDLLLFDDPRKVDTARAIQLTRNNRQPNPHANGKLAVMVKYPCTVGFVPLGAKRAGGAPHPHAGTGFGINHAHAWPLDDSDLVNEVQRKGRRAFQGDQAFSQLEVYQFAFDGRKFQVTSRQELALADLLSGWQYGTSPLTNAIPDGDDLLTAAAVAKPGRKLSAGLMRWRPADGSWRPVSYDPITAEDDSIEPSLVRDIDGELLFCARATRQSGHPIRVWKSSEKGTRWKMVIFNGGISSAPISLNQAADGTPYIAANRYQYQTHVKGRASVPYFRMPDGKPRPDAGTRESLMLWPLNDKRDALEIPVMVRDCLAEFGPPPHGTLWSADHPSAMTVQLGDGAWHNLLGYRAFEKEENTEFTAATQYTGAYLEEVISTGKPIPTWNF